MEPTRRIAVQKRVVIPVFPPEQQKHYDMMTTPGRWPRWPILPLKRYQRDEAGRQLSGMPECACLVALEGRMTVVYKATMFELSDAMKTKRLHEVEQQEYLSIALIVVDGWIVD